MNMKSLRCQLEKFAQSAFGAVKKLFSQRCERFVKRDSEKLAAGLRAISKLTRVHIKGPYVDHGEILYDERGLPK
jgi:hypothetical protein